VGLIGVVVGEGDVVAGGVGVVVGGAAMVMHPERPTTRTRIRERAKIFRFVFFIPNILAP
jgi:hypothetical protein